MAYVGNMSLILLTRFIILNIDIFGHFLRLLIVLSLMIKLSKDKCEN